VHETCGRHNRHNHQHSSSCRYCDSGVFEDCLTRALHECTHYYAPADGALSDYARLTSVCLSVSYIGPKSRTERPRKTEIGTEVAHVTRDSDTTFTVKKSKVKVTCEAGEYYGGLPHSLRSDRQHALAPKPYFSNCFVSCCHGSR